MTLALPKAFIVNPNPAEKELSKIKEKLDIPREYYQEQLKSWIQHEIQADATITQGTKDHIWAKYFQEKELMVTETIKDSYIEEFNCWILGKSKFNDKKYTPWGKHRLVGRTIENYLTQFVEKKSDFYLYMAKLRNKIPDNIVDAWLYFRLIVMPTDSNGVERTQYMKFLENNYLKDWAAWFNDSIQDDTVAYQEGAKAVKVSQLDPPTNDPSNARGSAGKKCIADKKLYQINVAVPTPGPTATNPDPQTAAPSTTGTNSGLPSTVSNPAGTPDPMDIDTSQNQNPPIPQSPPPDPNQPLLTPLPPLTFVPQPLPIPVRPVVDPQVLTDLQNDLAAANNRLKEIKRTLEDERQQLTMTQEENNRLNIEKNQLLEQKRNLEEQLQRQTNALNENNQLRTNLQNELAAANNRLNELRRTLEQEREGMMTQDEKNRLQADKRNLERRLEELQGEMNRLDEDNRIKISDLDMQIARKQNELDNALRTIGVNVETIKEHERRIAELLNKENLSSANYRQLLDSVNQLQGQVSNLQASNNELSTQLESLQTSSEALTNLKNQLQEELQTKNENLEASRLQMVELVRRAETQNLEIQNMQRFMESIRQLMPEGSPIIRTLDDAYRRIADLKQVRDQTLLDLQRLREQNTNDGQLTEQYRIQLMSAETSANFMRDQIKALTEELQKMQKEAGSARADLHKVREEKQRLIQQRNQKDQELQQKEHQLGELEQQNQQLLDQYNQTKNNLDTLLQNLNQLQGEKKDLEKELKLAIKEFHRMHGIFKEEQEFRVKFQQSSHLNDVAAKEWEARFLDVQDQFKLLQQNYQNLFKEGSQLQRQYDELHNEWRQMKTNEEIINTNLRSRLNMAADAAQKIVSNQSPMLPAIKEVAEKANNLDRSVFHATIDTFDALIDVVKQSEKIVNEWAAYKDECEEFIEEIKFAEETHHELFLEHTGVLKQKRIMEEILEKVRASSISLDEARFLQGEEEDISMDPQNVFESLEKKNKMSQEAKDFIKKELLKPAVQNNEKLTRSLKILFAITERCRWIRESMFQNFTFRYQASMSLGSKYYCMSQLLALLWRDHGLSKEIQFLTGQLQGNNIWSQLPEEAKNLIRRIDININNVKEHPKTFRQAMPSELKELKKVFGKVF